VKRQTYRIFKRKTNKKKIYYVRFLDNNGRIVKTLSTGESNQVCAVQWVEDYLSKEQDKQEHITLIELALGFWEPQGEYARRRKARGYSIGFKHLETCEGLIRNHILPLWGNRNITDIPTNEIERVILDLYRKKELASGSINKILQSIRSMFGQAVFKGYLKENPAALVKPVKNIYRKRGILTNAEVKALFALTWPDFRHYTINLLAFATGARLGEIRGLLLENVKPDRIEIMHSWEDKHGLKNPKFDSFRAVPISKKVYNCIRCVIKESCPENLLFFSNPDRKDIPIGKKCIEKHLYKAMELIGITQDERKERNVTFHSWRHKLNSLLRAQGVPDSKIRLLTGHRGSAMTDWYTNYTAEDFTDVVKTQTALLGGNHE